MFPYDITVYVWENRQGPAYFPEHRYITMPPEFLELIINLFDPYWEADEDVELDAITAFTWIFLHEAAHALIDQLNLPAVGLEEDAADQFASMLLIEEGDDEAANHAAFLFLVLADERGQPLAADYWDEHSLDDQRYSNILCWLYGKDPFEYVFVASYFEEAIDRLERCGDEYQQLKNSWDTLLEPHTET